MNGSLSVAGPATIVRWQDPPPAVRGEREWTPRRSRYERVAADLQAQPGRGAVVFEGPTNSASALAGAIRMGQARCWAPAGDFEAVCRVRRGVGTTYARYLGDPQAS
jgi:hypothetical protein